MSMLTELVHPDYQLALDNWIKWRYTYESGHPFILKYLKKFSGREDDLDFQARRDMTYCPAFAKAAVDEVKNSIYQRMSDVTRAGGSSSYQNASIGLQNGVDLIGSSMNYYIGVSVLEEMLKMKRVGVYVDMPTTVGPSLTDAVGKHPYMYTYPTEDIRTWALDDSQEPNRYRSILLRDYIYEYDTEFGFPTAYKERFRRIWKQDGVILVSFYDEKSNPVDKEGNPLAKPIILELKIVPFVMFEISDSLMKNIADYQIALLNLASSDISYALKSNFPFYTEEYDPRGNSPHLRPAEDGSAANAGTGANEEVKVGVSKGRRYPKGLHPPSFIHPSSEPLKASMEKQDQLKEEIRLLLNLTIANLTGPKMASADSKAKDEGSLESGLSYIGLTLENGERQIAEIWAQYERTDQVATIKYPDNYTLRSEADRRNEGEQLGKMLTLVPSKTYQKCVSKKLATVLLGASNSVETMSRIYKEIDAAPGLSSDSVILASDLDHGMVSTQTASILRGYSEDESKKAAQDHADRLARIQMAQVSPISDQTVDPQAGSKAKQAQQDVTNKASTETPVRGPGTPTE